MLEKQNWVKSFLSPMPSGDWRVGLVSERIVKECNGVLMFITF